MRDCLLGIDFDGMPIVPTSSAYGELEELALGLHDVKDVLEKGFDCSRSKRRTGIMERCLKKDGKILRVVVSQGYSSFMKEHVCVVVHVSLHGLMDFEGR